MKDINLSFNEETTKAFNSYYVSRYATYMQRVLLGITCLFTLSGFFDYLLASGRLTSIFIFRYSVVLPCLFCLNLLVFHRYFIQFIQPIIVIYILIICGFLFYLGLRIEQDVKIYYISGLVVTQLVSVSMLRLRFFYALAASFIIFFCSQIMLYVIHVSLTNFLLFNYFAGSITALGLTSNFFLEQSAKIEYLHRQMTQDEMHALEELNINLDKLAHTDTLTGLSNRRTFDEEWAKEWRRAHRSEQPISIVIADIDYFKKFNDHYGHQAGDICLKTVGKILKQFAQRPGDLAARYGGEEFIFLLSDTDLEEASRLTQQLINAIAEAKIPHEASPIGDYLSLSFGVSCINFSTTDIDIEEVLPSDLIRKADKNLYAAKEQGRNRMVADYL